MLVQLPLYQIRKVLALQIWKQLFLLAQILNFLWFFIDRLPIFEICILLLVGVFPLAWSRLQRSVIFFFKNFFFIDFTQLIRCFAFTYPLVKILRHLKELRVLPVDVFNIFFIVASEDTAVITLGWLFSMTEIYHRMLFWIKSRRLIFVLWNTLLWKSSWIIFGFIFVL